MRRSGSSITLSVISASISSGEMSSGASFCFWLISVKVFVRSTSVRLPSLADRSRIERCGRGLLGSGEVDPGEVDGGEKDGMWGALSDIVGFFGLSAPKYAANVCDICLWS